MSQCAQSALHLRSTTAESADFYYALCSEYTDAILQDYPFYYSSSFRQKLQNVRGNIPTLHRLSTVIIILLYPLTMPSRIALFHCAVESFVPLYRTGDLFRTSPFCCRTSRLYLRRLPSSGTPQYLRKVAVHGVPEERLEMCLGYVILYVEGWSLFFVDNYALYAVKGRLD